MKTEGFAGVCCWGRKVPLPPGAEHRQQLCNLLILQLNRS